MHIPEHFRLLETGPSGPRGPRGSEGVGGVGGRGGKALGVMPSPDSGRNVKFIYSEKATRTVVKSKVKISQNFVAFSEYMNFMKNFFFKKALDYNLAPLDRRTFLRPCRMATTYIAK